MKKNFLANITEQVEKKEQSALENKVIRYESENKELRQKIRHLEDSYNNSPENQVKIKISSVKLTENIRDEYEYEEIEQLAVDILKHGQLQPVVLTNDGYLLMGYRRYNAVKLLNSDIESLKLPVDLKNKKEGIPDFLLACYLDSNLSELTREVVDELQFAENNERRSLDNFQISRLFNKHIKNGASLDDVCNKFKKSKSFVSSVLALNKIDEQLIKLVKEFQIFAWSKSRFTAVNLQSVTEEKNSFYEKNKGIIGWKPLYDIAKQPDSISQKRMFLKLFKNRLSEEELNSEYFRDVYPVQKKVDEGKIKAFYKHTKGLNNLIKQLDEGLPKDIIDQLKKNINQIESVLVRISN